MDRKKTEELFANWWRGLQENKGAKAELKRCASPEEVALHSEAHRLKKLIPWLPFEAVATLAGISAHIKGNTNIDFATSLAMPKEKNGRVPLSESRFRQLLTSHNWNELYRSLRRTITILDGQVSLTSFIDTIILWNSEFQGNYNRPGKSVKFKLSQGYYETAMKYEK